MEIKAARQFFLIQRENFWHGNADINRRTCKNVVNRCCYLRSAFLQGLFSWALQQVKKNSLFVYLSYYRWGWACHTGNAVIEKLGWLPTSDTRAPAGANVERKAPPLRGSSFSAWQQRFRARRLRPLTPSASKIARRPCGAPTQPQLAPPSRLGCLPRRRRRWWCWSCRYTSAS